MRSFVLVFAALTTTLACGGADPAPAPRPVPRPRDEPQVGFTLTVAPPELAISAGGEATIKVAITTAADFAESVNVVVTGLPDGVSASPLTLGSSGEADLRFSATASAPLGRATATISATSATGAFARSHPLAVDVRGLAGSLDVSFGAGGVASDLFEEDAEGYSVVTEPDGKVVLAGFTNPEPSSALLARLTAEGTRDPTFSGGSIVSTFGGSAAKAYAVARDPDGNLVVVGQVTGGSSVTPRFAVARYYSDGSSDPMFGVGGVRDVLFDGTGYARGVALARNGNILAVGNAFSTASVPEGQSQFAWALLSPTGEVKKQDEFTPDGSVGHGFTDAAEEGSGDFFMVGSESYRIDGEGGARRAVAGMPNQVDLELLPDGKLLTCGFTGVNRFTAAGTPDGFAVAPAFTERAVALQPDGKVLVAGVDGTAWKVARYHPDGQLDPTFGEGGIGTIAHPGKSAGSLHGIAVTADRKIVLVGAVTSAAPASRVRVEVVRLWQ